MCDICGTTFVHFHRVKTEAEAKRKRPLLAGGPQLFPSRPPPAASAGPAASWISFDEDISNRFHHFLKRPAGPPSVSS